MIEIPKRTELTPTPLKQFSWPFHLEQSSFAVNEVVLVGVHGHAKELEPHILFTAPYLINWKRVFIK